MYHTPTLIERSIDHAAFLYQGVRKILVDQTFSTGWPGADPPTDWYGRNKMAQLRRNYWNISDLERCRGILDKRRKQSFTSVAVSMRNAAKDSRSQGWCMNSLVIMRTRDSTHAEIQYRSTELILKFTGDYLFLPEIFKFLEVEPQTVTFRFASCYLSAVYFPYISHLWESLDHEPPAVSFLKRVKQGDEKLFQAGTRFFLRSAYREDQVFPYSPENVAHRYNWKVNRRHMSKIREYLEAMHKGLR